MPIGWKLDSASCALLLTTPTPTGTPTTTGVDNLEIQSGVVTRCTFNDSLIIRTLSITKVATEQSYDSVGDVINYTITATNTGNVAQSLTVYRPEREQPGLHAGEWFDGCSWSVDDVYGESDDHAGGHRCR